MASLNPLTRELVFKVVFYGPGLGGKTTTLQYIHATTKPEHRGKMVSLATPMDRTLYFDFLPLRVPRVHGMSVRLQLFTVPGQVYYGATRKLVLTGADGVVFVADSQGGRQDANQESLEDLVTNLADHNRALSQLPHTFHWNKRDLSDLVPLEELDRKFNPHGAPSLGTVATHGDGVFEGLERITRLVLRAYEAELPKNEGRSLETRQDSEEAGIADAIRGLTETPHRSKVTPFSGTRAVVTQKPSNAPETQPERAPSDRVKGERPSSDRNRMDRDAFERPKLRVRSAPPERPASSVPPPTRVPSGELEVDARERDARVAPAVGVPTAMSPSPSSAFSFADLWAESERETVREAESAIASRNAAAAVLACDLLLTRVLASAAGLTGNADAPRDPGMAALLLDLEGKRYLAFRAAVRAARQHETVTMREAFDCYTFTLEARRARESIGT